MSAPSSRARVRISCASLIAVLAPTVALGPEASAQPHAAVARCGPQGCETLLGPNADTPGDIVPALGTTGLAYASWDRAASSSSKADTVLFCRISANFCTSPTALHLPSPAGSAGDPVAPFPVVGNDPKDDYVVAPRYAAGDVVVWESVNYGLSFGAPKTYTNYADGTDVDDVLLTPFSQTDNFSIGSENPSLGYTWVVPQPRV